MSIKKAEDRKPFIVISLIADDSHPGFFAGPYLRWSKLYNLKFENTEGERVAVANPNDIDSDENILAEIGWIKQGA